MKELLAVEVIEGKILIIRGRKVMLDRDLAELYGVEVGQLKRQVRRNMERFPGDFMFRLSEEENNSLRSHFGTLKRGKHSKYRPYVFTEQGVAMLSGLLRSKRAVLVNIQIMRVFVKLRQLLLTHKELALQVAQLERRIEGHDEEISAIFDAIRELMKPPEGRRRRIGFSARDRRAVYRTSGKR
jgi:hypothetical protein